MRELLNRWNTYWFHPASLVDLAICRVLIVGFQLFILIKRDHYTGFLKLSSLPDALYDPLPVLHLLIWPFGWNYRPPFESLEIIYWMTLAAGIFALIGLKTNVSLAIFAVGNVFMQAFVYSFGDFHHHEGLMMITLSILALSPCGQALSIDDVGCRLRRNFRKRTFENFNVIDEKSHFARWPILLTQWIFVLIYLSSAVAKLTLAGLDWMNGYTLQYSLFEDGMRYGSNIAVWMGQYHIVAWLLSWVTILFEGTFFLVLLFPFLAWFYIPVGVALHTGIYVTMRAPFFQFIAIYAVFIPWARLFKSLSHRLRFPQPTKKPEILFDGQCPLCIRSMTLVRYLDWFDRFALADLETQWARLSKSHPELSLEDCRREMHVVLPDGSVQKGFFAFREILWFLPPLWPLLVPFYLPLAPALGSRLYRFVASRRLRFDQCTSETCLLHHGG